MAARWWNTLFVICITKRTDHPQRLPSRGQVPITMTDQSGPLTWETIDLQIGFWTGLDMNITLYACCLYPLYLSPTPYTVLHSPYCITPAVRTHKLCSTIKTGMQAPLLIGVPGPGTFRRLPRPSISGTGKEVFDGIPLSIQP